MGGVVWYFSLVNTIEFTLGSGSCDAYKVGLMLFIYHWQPPLIYL